MGNELGTQTAPARKPNDIVQMRESAGWGADPRGVRKYHLRALATNNAVGRGSRGAKRFVTQSRAFNALPNASAQSYVVTRSIAERAHQHNMRPGNMFRNS
jgi:hypothetical protein